MNVTQIAFIAYPITDASRARAFYENVLALKPAQIFEKDGQCWIEYDIGAGTLALTSFYSAGENAAAAGPSAGLEVENFEGTIITLRKAGARFLGEPIFTPKCRMVRIADPDGNAIIIHKHNAG